MRDNPVLKRPAARRNGGGVAARCAVRSSLLAAAAATAAQLVCPAVVLAQKAIAGPTRPVPSAAARPPAGAYVRQLGVIPAQRKLTLPAWTKSKMGFAAMEANTELSIRGISLGGIGAGSFQINQSGTFGPWSFGAHEMRILPQAAFHVRVQKAGGAPLTRTLAIDGPLGKLPGAWPTIQPGSATYSAMYPFGWIDYRNLGADVGLRFWSPIVAGEERRTSMPLSYFDVALGNPTSAPITVSVMFTFPNAPIHVPGSGKVNWMTAKPMHVPDSIRRGLGSRAEHAGNVTGVTLSAADARNTPDAQDTAWSIAVLPRPAQRVSWVPSWNGAGDGADIMTAFSRTGTLPNTALDRSNSAGAIAVSVVLAPGERTTIPMALAWDVPREVYTVAPHPATPANPFRPAQAAIKGGTTVWMKRYTGFLGARTDARNSYIKGSYRPQRSFEIASRGLLDRESALQAVETWWAPITTNPSIPAWLSGAALNQTSYLTFGHSFWALGLESDTVGSPNGGRIGAAIPDTHPFFVDTGAEGGDESTMNGDVGPYAFLATQLLFPDIERDILLTQGELLRRSKDAQLHNLGSTDGGSPFVMWDNEGGNYHIDRTILFAVRWWRYVQTRRDDRMFRWLYPVMVQTWNRHRANFFREGSRLPFDPSFQANTHDMLGVNGHGVYNSALWILFEDLMAEATKKAVDLGVDGADPAFAAQLRSDSALARQEFESAFWEDGKGYYRFDTGRATPYSGGLFADALYPEHLAAVLGLPAITRPDRLRRHLWSVDRILVEPFRTPGGLPVGAANLTDDNGKLYGGLDIGDKPLGEAPDGREVWPGAVYPLSTLMMTVGERTGDRALSAKGLEIAQGVSHVIWDRPDLGYAFLAPDAWAAEDPAIHRNPNYLRPLSVWDLLHRLAPSVGAPR